MSTLNSVSLLFSAGFILQDDINLRYTGSIESNISSLRAELYRLKQSYITQSISGYWSTANTETQAGISIEFKTASPSVSLSFNINNEYADHWGQAALDRYSSQ